MVCFLHELARRLLGSHASLGCEILCPDPADEDATTAWIAACKYLELRIQSKPQQKPGREPDMSEAGAAAFIAVMKQLRDEAKSGMHLYADTASSAHGLAFNLPFAARQEASRVLTANHERVVNDIVNPSSTTNIDGKALTQLALRRLKPTERDAVDQFLREVAFRLAGEIRASPLSKQDALTWIAAGKYLNGRLQSVPEQKPGRKPDMSPEAAKAMRAVMDDAGRWCKLRVSLDETGICSDENPSLASCSRDARYEAAYKLISNHERVLADLTNQSSTNIDGKPLTQTFTIKRLLESDRPHVDRFLYEVARRLLGAYVCTDSIMPIPTDEDAATIWVAACNYLETRIQSTPEQKPGREPDMSVDAAEAMVAVMRQLRGAANAEMKKRRLAASMDEPPAQASAKLRRPSLKAAAQAVVFTQAIRSELVSPWLMRNDGNKGATEPPV